MTPSEKNIVRSLVAVAWADGQLADGESSVIEGLLTGFDATEAEEKEILDYARTERTLEKDIPLADLQGGARFGVSALGRGGVLARLLCPSAPSLETSVGALWSACRRLLLDQPPLALRKL